MVVYYTQELGVYVFESNYVYCDCNPVEYDLSWWIVPGSLMSED